MTLPMLRWLALFCAAPLALFAPWLDAVPNLQTVLGFLAGTVVMMGLVEATLARYGTDDPMQRRLVQLIVLIQAVSVLFVLYLPLMFVPQAHWLLAVPAFACAGLALAIAGDWLLRAKLPPADAPALPPGHDPGWFDWFAWYPVRLSCTRRWVWLRPVQYRPLRNGVLHRAQPTGDGLWS